MRGPSKLSVLQDLHLRCKKTINYCSFGTSIIQFIIGEFIGNKPSVRYAPASEGDWLVRVLQASFAREALDDPP